MTDPHDHPTPVIAYFECFSGASGDMILGALVDAGWPIHALRDALEGMPLDGWELDVSATKKGALRATKVTIRVTAPQPERSVLEIVPMIKASRLSDTVKARAIALFRELADVEALQHADEPDNVHFHEVGAVDSILDIVGSVAGLEALDARHFASLVGGTQVLVDDADAALLRHRDCETGFGHGVHRGRQQRNVQRDIPGQFGSQGRVGREDVGVGRDEQHIIEGECFLDQTHRDSCRRKSELYRNHPAASRRPDETGL